MRGRRLLLRLGIAAVLLCAAGAAGLWWLGGTLVAPRPAVIGPPPADLHAREVRIAVPQAPPVAGWWIAGEPGRASVLLLHGIRSDRRAMLERARLLSRHGYAVLLIDLPAHGESPGEAITLGWREAAAVTAARDWMHEQRPGEKRAVIGVSLGGASVVLGPQPSGFDVVVLEAVYSDARQAIRNRIAMRLGDTAAALSPLLAMQAEWRLGIPVRELSPSTASQASAHRCWWSRADRTGIRCRPSRVRCTGAHARRNHSGCCPTPPMWTSLRTILPVMPTM